MRKLFLVLYLSMAACSFAVTILHNTFLMTSTDGDREGVVVHGQAYYQSTGTSSNHSQTLFPFNGLRRIINGNWLVKPGNYADPVAIIQNNFINQITNKDARSYFIGVLDHIASDYPQCNNHWQCGVVADEQVAELFIRFFSLTAASVSYQVGDGFWAVEPEDQHLFLVRAALVSTLKAMGVEGKSLSLAKEYIKTFNINSCDVTVFNDFLRQQGAKI